LTDEWTSISLNWRTLTIDDLTRTVGDGSVTEIERASEIIGIIYDAAIEPKLWLNALAETCAFCRCAVGALYSHDMTRREPTFHMLWGLDAANTKSYLEEYGPINPLIPAHLAADAGDILAASRMPLWDDFVNSSFFRDWGGPQGFLDSLSAIVERTPTRLSMVSCIRHEREGLVDDISFARMGLLRPHFLRAIKIGQALELRSVQISDLAESLDGLSAAVFIIDQRGNLAHSNATGDGMLRQASIFRLRSGRVQAISSAVQADLATALTQMRDGKTSEQAPAVAIEAATGERYIAHLLPLTAGFRRKAGLAYSASAAIFVVRVPFDVTAATALIATEFRLTPAELRVLRAVAEIGGVADIASTLGVSEETTRTHLRHLFDKTDVRSQSDLIRLVAAHISPLRPLM
jgi:DNA-binding CsgD family transcriptional regulator